MQKIKILRHPLLGQTAHFGFCPPKIGFFRGLGGVPGIFFPLESSYFCDLGAHAKNQNPTTPPYASLAMVVRKEEEKRKIPKIVAYGTFRLNRLHSAARTNKKINTKNSGLRRTMQKIKIL